VLKMTDAGQLARHRMKGFANFFKTLGEEV
jgi:hypothetical protein